MRLKEWLFNKFLNFVKIANSHDLEIPSEAMDKIEFDPFVELKIHDIISLAIDRENLKFEDALEYLYGTKLYEALIDERTKLWHLSAEKLFEILTYEKQTHKLIFPDYV